MKNIIIARRIDKYLSFPLIEQLERQINVGFFSSSVPDHAGMFGWTVKSTFDDSCENWEYRFSGETNDSRFDLPALSPRQRYDSYAYQLGQDIMTIGSVGFYKSPVGRKKQTIKQSSEIAIINVSQHKLRFVTVPSASLFLTFPRPLMPTCVADTLRIVPAYLITEKDKRSRAMVLRSVDAGETWRLFNMFPDEIEASEMAFIWTETGLLALIRSESSPFLLESWSEDEGLTWTYPTHCSFSDSKNAGIIGGPPHLLRLKNNRILCSYGYRGNGGMGIRAVISDDEGQSWSQPIVLRNDGGYSSSLRKTSLFKKQAWPGNDTGYPVSCQLKSGEILTVYYITTQDRITGIEATRWQP